MSHIKRHKKVWVHDKTTKPGTSLRRQSVQSIEHLHPWAETEDHPHHHQVVTLLPTAFLSNVRALYKLMEPNKEIWCKEYWLFDWLTESEKIHFIPAFAAAVTSCTLLYQCSAVSFHSLRKIFHISTSNANWLDRPSVHHQTCRTGLEFYLEEFETL